MATEVDPLAFQKGFAATQSIFDNARQNRLAQMTMQRAEDAYQQDQAANRLLAAAVGPDGAIDRTKALTGYAQAGLGLKIPALQTQFAQQDKEQREAQKAQLDQHLQTVDIASRALSTVRDQAGLDQARAYLATISPEGAASLPATYDKATLDAIVARGMSLKDQVTQRLQQMQFEETQRHNQATEAATRRGQDMSAQTATEGRAVTMRGQDMTDARARDANALQGDLKQIQLRAAQEKELEKGQAKQAQIANAEDSLAVLDKAISHPGRETATGVSGVIDPRNKIPGTDAKNFQVVLDQIKGQAFMQAYQNLRGGGQITEVEGKKATDAIARLNTAQSDAEFLTALNDLRGVMNAGYKRLTGKDYGAPQAAGSAGKSNGGKAVARTGTLPDGRRVVQYTDGTTEYAN